MTAASITWTDATGTDSLSTFPGVPQRFNNWTPNYVPVGPKAVGLGTGQTFVFPFRNDLTVALEIAPLAGTYLDLALRLKLHLLDGGSVVVSTTNFMSTYFETCILAPKTEPQISFLDSTMMEYSFAVILKSGGGLRFAVSTDCATMRLGAYADSVTMPFAGEITRATLQVSPSGNAVVDVLKNGVSICAAARPTVSGGVLSVDATLTGWTKTFAIGDVYTFNVISSTVKELTLGLSIKKT